MRVLRWISTDQTLAFDSGADEVPETLPSAAGLEGAEPDLPEGTPLSTAGPGTPAVPRPVTAPQSTEFNTSTTTPATAAVTPALDTPQEDATPAPQSEAQAAPTEAMEVDPAPSEIQEAATTKAAADCTVSVEHPDLESRAANDTEMADLPTETLPVDLPHSEPSTTQPSPKTSSRAGEVEQLQPSTQVDPSAPSADTITSHGGEPKTDEPVPAIVGALSKAPAALPVDAPVGTLSHSSAGGPEVVSSDDPAKVTADESSAEAVVATSGPVEEKAA